MNRLANIEAATLLAPSPPVADCRGACLPTPAGATIDRLYSHCLLSLRQPALAAIESASASCVGWIRNYLDKLREAIARQPAHDFVAAFRPAVAFFHLDPLVIKRNPVEAGLGLVRFLVGGPNSAPAEFLVPEQAIPKNGLYFPHLNIVLASGCGPLAVQSDGDGAKFTWVDGVAATVPANGLGTPATFDSERMMGLEWAAGWPILNRAPEARDPLLPVSPAPTGRPAAADLAVIESAQELLREVWPEAYTATRRYLHSAMLQPVQPERWTSTTTDLLQGTLIASCANPIQVADAMCHEGSHARLHLFLRVDPLIEDNGAQIYESPWRPDNRPLMGLLKGVHAFVNVALFYSRLGEQHPEMAAHAGQIYDEQRAKVRRAWATFMPRARPTRLGASLIAELDSVVRSL